jgi:DNA modification methylase
MSGRVEHIGENVTLYLGDCREILPTLGKVDAVVTDPPYGISRDRGMGGGGYDGFGGGVKRNARTYVGEWDADRPTPETFRLMLDAGEHLIIWGGNYFSDCLPMSQKWLFWDKLQTMPSYSDGEMAWTNLPGTSTKKFTYNGSGLMSAEKGRVHPTQKPVELLSWCIGLIPPPATLIIDPFMGSGTTGVAVVRRDRKFIGIEIEPKYFDIACRRIANEASQSRMVFEEEKPKPIEQARLEL